MGLFSTKGNFDFKNPPNEYGEVAFFWWQGDDITKEKLLWILNQLKDKHICGLQINYCHGNSGGLSFGLTMKSNPRPFSEEWWELLGWFISECKKYNIAVSLSDYTLASPGQGYFMDEVLKKHPEMLGQCLIMRDGKVVIEKRDNSINPMAQGVGDAYIEEFYAQFERRFPGECGKGINYFFSDELQFNVRGALWCDDFQEEFLRRKGYDITEKWEAIFQDIGNETPKIRLDYYDVIVQLSEERFFKKIYDWHEMRGMTFGCDHGGRGTDITEFGDYFRTMKWNQGPGSDQPYLESNIIKAKCAASIAHMYQRKRVWLEGFYGSGWATGCDDVIDATFRNFALGYNLLSLHGLYYSTHGSMWEWAPPCNHYHMPYWQQMGSFLECSKRLSYLLAQGTHCCDVAVIYPVAAAEADDVQGQQAAETAFEIAKQLYAHKIDFDFVDFESIARANVDKGALNISNESFKVVIVPEMETVRFGMMEKLREFAAAGGHVIFIKCLPTSSDRIGRNDVILDEIINDILRKGSIVNSCNEVIEIIRKICIFDFSSDAENVYFQHRKIENKDYYIIYRMPFGKTVKCRATGYPVMLNPWNGEKYKIDSYNCINTVNKDGEMAYITELTMPLMDREIFVLMFENEKKDWEKLPQYVSFSSDNDELISVNGEWDSTLIPTMDNKYGDWRLPAFDGCITAEARELEYCFSDEEGDISKCQDWKKSFYSYGTYFYMVEGAVDEQKLISAEQPTSEMREYRFSMKYGVEGDAGSQNSYHGLKGLISDEFLTMGKKRLTYVNSDSVYEGEGPYYFFTTFVVDGPIALYIETGNYKPDKIWIDHTEIVGEQITLNKGRHYLLLRFPHGGRSYFVLKKENTFRQTYPLVTSWYKNTDIVLFDAMPQMERRYCCYRFNAPVGAKTMTVPTQCAVYAYINDFRLDSIGKNKFALNQDGAVEVLLFVQQERGKYDTAVFDDAITFDVGMGKYDITKSMDLQGLSFYSGGISLKKTIFVKKDGRRKFFKLPSNIGCAAELYVNSKSVAVLLTEPYCCDITEHLLDGENEIRVEIFNDLHNHMKTIPTNYNQRIGKK